MLRSLYLIGIMCFSNFMIFAQLNTQVKRPTGESKIEDYLSVLNTIPIFFIGWNNNIEKIAKEQDKSKLANIGKNIYTDIGEVIIANQRLTRLLKDTTKTVDYRTEFGALQEKVNKLSLSIKNSQYLAKSIGLQTTIISNELYFNIVTRSLIMETLFDLDDKTQEKQYRLFAIKKLREGTLVLENTRAHVRKLVILVEKSNTN